MRVPTYITHRLMGVVRTSPHLIAILILLISSASDLSLGGNGSLTQPSIQPAIQLKFS